MSITTFLGSSVKSLPSVQDIELVLRRVGHEVQPWNLNVFHPGDITFERLRERAASVDAAVFVLGEDRPLKNRRSAASENVVLELGLFCGALGNDRVVICREGHPGIPSDLAGVTYIDLTPPRRAAGLTTLGAWATKVTRRSCPVVKSQCGEALQGLASFPIEDWRQRLLPARNVSILQTFIPYHQHLALFAAELGQALETGCRVEVLLCDPWSGACTTRQTSIARVVSDVRGNVEQTLRVFARIHAKLSVDARKRLEARVYSTLPSVSVYRADDVMIEGVYLHDRLAIDGPQLCHTASSCRGRFIEQEYARIWSEPVARRVPLDDLENWLKAGPFRG